MPIYDVTRMYKLEHTIKGVEAKNEEDAFDVANEQFVDIDYDEYKIVKSDTYVVELEEEGEEASVQVPGEE